MKISPITLGTVQLGIPYGIANQKGQPTEKDSIDILKFAFANGINSFDTAPSYGESEKRIGKFVQSIQKLKSKNEIIITTKASNLGETTDFSEKKKQNLALSVKKSLESLQITKIPIFLLHNPAHLYDHDIITSLIDLQKKKLVDHIGVSVYTPDEVQQFLDIKELDAIQIPINIFDQRLIERNLLQELNSKKKIVFARSVYLQGLFFLKPESLPDYLSDAKPYLQKLNSISLENQLSISQIALSFVRDLPGITSLILGVESIEQLKSNLEIFSVPRLDDDITTKLANLFRNIPERILNPAKWKN